MSSNDMDERVAAILNADEEYRAYVQQNNRYCATVNAGFPGKGDDPAQVIDDAINRALCYLIGSTLTILRLASVTTTVISHPYADMVLVTVIAEPLPKMAVAGKQRTKKSEVEP